MPTSPIQPTDRRVNPKSSLGSPPSASHYVDGTTRKDKAMEKACQSRVYKLVTVVKPVQKMHLVLPYTV